MNEKILAESRLGGITKIVCIVLLVLGGLAFASVVSSDFFFALISALPAWVAASVIYYVMPRCKLTITDKRAYFTGILGKRVDLPFDSISAIGTTWLVLTVTTPSGKIILFDAANRKEMYQILCDLLLQRQGTQPEDTDIPEEHSSSNPDVF